MKKRKYIVIGVAILLVVSILSIRTINFNVTSVKQDNKDYSEGTSDQCNKNALESKYSPTIEKEEGTENVYKISLTGNKEKIGADSFKVENIDIGTSSNDLSQLPELTANNDVTLNITPGIEKGVKAVKVTLRLVSSADNCNFSYTIGLSMQGESVKGKGEEIPNTNIGTGKICTNFINGNYNASQLSSYITKSDFEKYNYSAVNQEGKNYYQEFVKYCWQETVTAGANYTEKETAELLGMAVSSWKIYTSTVDNTTPEFNTAFNEVKTNAINSGNSQENSSNLKLNYSLKCNYNVNKNSTDYYQNKTYYYASQKTTGQNITYTYHYAPGNVKTETKKDVCERNCEEAVKVEYGPPVASKAGLCFEYKVKVTSYVKCDSKLNVDLPQKTDEYCSPSPYCNNGIPALERQGGPNEEFEQCIQECDGGKYTAKCSNKCYKKVYKQSNNKLAINYEDGYEVTKLNLSDEEKASCAASDGCYYYNGNTINWKTKENGNEFGRWYRDTNYCKTDAACKAWDGFDTYFALNGIKKGYNCSDVCSWQAGVCSKNEYLNPGDSAKDYIANLKEYKAVENQCKASATCTSTTAEFTISIKYDTKNGNKTTINEINYPYSSNKDSLSSKGSGNEGLNTSTNDNSTILQYGGCYDSSDAKRWYMTEWSFPGTWINNKTGEISFKSKDGKGWYSEKDKFCMPLDAQSVNTKWWEWTTRNNSCQTEEAVKKELGIIDGGKQGKDYTTTDNSNGYNIKATTKKFGYFGWNFDIQCFYALKNEVCNLDNKGCCDNSCTGNDCDSTIITPSEGYTVRTVDRANLFPNSEHSPTLDNANVQKRKIGFNWTEGATVNLYKNEGYTVDPVALIDHIQSTSSTLYDEEPDYKFTLTRETLTKIRSYNKQNDFGKWNGNTENKNGIITYQSTFLRNQDYTGTNKKLGTPGVNNE